MNDIDQRNQVSQRRLESKAVGPTGLFWMLFPVALLVVSVSGWLFMVKIAVDDPGFSVESDYYKKASSFDEVLAQRARNERLGWRARVVEGTWVGANEYRLAIELTDREGLPLPRLKVEVETFAVARGGDLHRAPLVEDGEGRYVLVLGTPRTGLWELRLTALEGDTLFSEVLRTEISSPKHPHS